MAQPKVRAAAVMGASFTKRAPTDGVFILPPLVSNPSDSTAVVSATLFL